MRPVENGYEGTYWTAAREHRLEIERCRDCGHWIHYPKGWCPRCRTRNVRAEAVSGRGRLVSHTTTHRPPVPVEHTATPVVHVLVELEEQAGLRVAATLTGGVPRIGARVHVVWDDRDGYTLPRFALDEED